MTTKPTNADDGGATTDRAAALAAKLRKAMDGHTYARKPKDGEYFMNMTLVNQVISSLDASRPAQDIVAEGKPLRQCRKPKAIKGLIGTYLCDLDKPHSSVEHYYHLSETDIAALETKQDIVGNLREAVEARKAECERIAKKHSGGDMSLSYDGEARGMDFVLAILSPTKNTAPTDTKDGGIGGR